MIRRLTQLYVGLVGYGLSLAMIVRARLGLDPWDVLHQGISHHTGQRIGTVLIVVSIVVLLAWIPLRQRPGLGTISNALLVGVFMNIALDWMPEVTGRDAGTWVLRGLLLVGGVVLNGIATAAYIGARFGPGPRDGLMTGLHHRTGRSIRTVRTAIELIVLAAGWALGGSIGVGTVAYALGIGPVAHAFMPLLHITDPGAADGEAAPDPA
ncbi:membrane protein YczE [Mariniluteicoccus flavus]